MKIKQRLALIDDDPLMLGFLEAYLSDDFELASFQGVEEFATALPDMGKLHAVISDLNLGKFSGRDLVHITRANQGTSKIPIILLSAENKSQTRVDCLKIGADDFLTKPFNPEELLLNIHKMIRLKAA